MRVIFFSSSVFSTSLRTLGQLLGLVVLAQGDDEDVLLVLGVGLDQLLDLGKLHEAGAAPGCPEVDHDDLAREVALGERLGLARAVEDGEGEARGGLTDELVDRILLRLLRLGQRLDLGEPLGRLRRQTSRPGRSLVAIVPDAQPNRSIVTLSWSPFSASSLGSKTMSTALRSLVWGSTSRRMSGPCGWSMRRALHGVPSSFAVRVEHEDASEGADRLGRVAADQHVQDDEHARGTWPAEEDRPERPLAEGLEGDRLGRRPRRCTS